MSKTRDHKSSSYSEIDAPLQQIRLEEKKKYFLLMLQKNSNLYDFINFFIETLEEGNEDKKQLLLNFLNQQKKEFIENIRSVLLLQKREKLLAELPIFEETSLSEEPTSPISQNGFVRSDTPPPLESVDNSSDIKPTNTRLVIPPSHSPQPTIQANTLLEKEKEKWLNIIYKLNDYYVLGTGFFSCFGKKLRKNRTEILNNTKEKLEGATTSEEIFNILADMLVDNIKAVQTLARFRDKYYGEMHRQILEVHPKCKELEDKIEELMGSSFKLPYRIPPKEMVAKSVTNYYGAASTIGFMGNMNRTTHPSSTPGEKNNKNQKLKKNIGN